MASKGIKVKLTVNADDGKSGFTHEFSIEGSVIDQLGYNQAVSVLTQDLVGKFQKAATTLKARVTGNYGHLSVAPKK